METLLAKALGEAGSGPTTAAEKQHLLARLLARMAHEIRNPLSSLDIHVQLLEEDVQKLAPEVRKKFSPRFEIIRGELHRLENVVRHFLRLASPSELNLEIVAPEQIIAHVCDLLRPEAQARRIELRAVQPAEEIRLRADPVQLTQALINLVINGLQAVETQGWVEIELRAEPDQALFVVRDSGSGVLLENAQTIFEPYFSTRPQGSGLGLWIVQQIATAHQGSVQVGNAPGAGAVFIFKIPLHSAIAPAPEAN